ncbi:hypothetical protein [Paludisphaera mucosa]|uniref:Uncharacterized protein n=1 Tax=Paludisphaera mucosa TaxID=3030827 RepID=A0ABT6FC04_9BACT|nr:hypothetical protein [Paludisphaera mucosa]MDG3005101.1 hypothetical protein [Paludisphaera mucosa]
MRVSKVFCLVVAAAFFATWQAEARAQSAPGTHFNRTRSGDAGASTPTRAPARRASAFEGTAARTTRLGADPLAPYSSRPREGSGSPASAAPPAPPPITPPVVRNYYPTARSGQVRHHCTPSRAGVYGSSR